MTSFPLVTAICVTKDREQFLPKAIEQFLEQDYPNKELVIIGDQKNLGGLIPKQRNVFYSYWPGGLRSVGAKRNSACEVARGEFICHWDDDDWFLPRRISEQAAVLIDTGKAVTGYRDMLFRDPISGRDWMFTGGDRYAVGVSLFYRRAFWEHHQFTDVVIGEDNEWINGVGDADMEIRTGAQIIARIHSDNTCQKREEVQLRNREYWRELAA